MKEITLENFRCYECQSVSFKPGINLLVGDNATGKTSILRACKYVMSSFFAGFSDDNTRWITFKNDDFRQTEANNILSQELPIKIHFDIGDMVQYKDLIESGLFEPTYQCTIQKNSTKNEKALSGGIKQYKQYASTLLNFYIEHSEQKKALPLFANFSTQDIHSTRKFSTEKFKDYKHKPSFGYYECLDGDGFLVYWIKRLLVLKEWDKNQIEEQIVRQAIKDALGAKGCNIIQDIDIRVHKSKVYFHFIDGREVETDCLSDGYRRLVNVVVDLAFRCAFLNRGLYGQETCKKTIGTVLIDEIDLHLHPTLQSLVLKGLRNAFPKVQFIVSSHAPMVMSSVESNDENEVFKLDFSVETGYSVESTVTYGMDLSTISKVILRQPPRSAQVDEELVELFGLMDKAEYEKAIVLLADLKRRPSLKDLPDLVEAQAMLDCVVDE